MAPKVGGGEEGSGLAIAREDGRERRGLLRETGKEEAAFRGEDRRHAHRGGVARHERRVAASRDRGVLLDRLLRERQHARGSAPNASTEISSSFIGSLNAHPGCQRGSYPVQQR